MKTSSLIAAALMLTFSLCCTQSFAQSVGTAADKQKQANLEKNKARQNEMHKKYNSMTPAQAAEAEKRANEYKKGGYKTANGNGAKTTTTAKPAATPATGTSKQGVNSAKPTQTKASASKPKTTAKPQPVLMDANGKPAKTASATKTVPKTSAANPNAAENKVKTTAPVKK